MLTFKGKKTMKPLYDYYVETDLDTIDDQPIDFSKRYDDQLADDVCSSSSGKKRHMSSPSAVPNKIPGDELKVYCIEGTPLIISSASSLCDLHEIGALIQSSETEPHKQNPINKPGFKELYSDPSKEANSSTKSDEILQTREFEDDQEKNKEESVEVENTSRSDENFSKASSPLMFSRSSSICSLNSFEQHSIVDDRSSVSMFSNLASGIISPSEIPDSPGEAMSPFTHKRRTEFVFPPNDSQKSMDPVLAKLKLTSDPPFADEAFEDIPEDNLKVFNDEGDCCSESNLSALSIQASSLSHVSVAVFHKNAFPNVAHKSSIRISCSIVTGNAELQSIDEDGDKSKKYSMHAASSKENCAESSCIKAFPNYSVSSVADDDCQDEKINYSSLNPEEDESKDEDNSPAENFDFDDDYEPCSNSFENPIEEMAFIPENESPDYSKDISDDECDDLLEECIKKGMQESTSHHQNTNQPLSTSCQRDQESNTKEEEFQEQNISNSDCDTSGSEEEDELLQSCIQLGMPQKSTIPLDQVPIQSSGNSDQKPSNSPAPEDFSKEMDEVSDDEEYDPLLQHIIHLGEPKNEPKESCQKKLKDGNSYPCNDKKLGYRDNRPDGSSGDEDEDDDILIECIQAGMPKPKPETIHHQNQYASPTKTLPMKPQPYPQRTSSASQDRANYMSSFAGPHLKSVKSPTREDKTMHQTYKIYQLQQHPKSTAGEARMMPLPGHTKSHQRQPFKRCPTAEDRTISQNSFSGQYQPQPHKRSPTTEQTRSLAALNGQYQSPTHRRSPTTEDHARPLATYNGQYQSPSHRRCPTTDEQTRSLAMVNRHCQSQTHRRSLTTEEQTRSLAIFNGQCQSQTHRRYPITEEHTKIQHQSQTHKKSVIAESRSVLLATFNEQCQRHRSSANIDRVPFPNAGQHRKSPSTPERTRVHPPANSGPRTSPGNESKAVYARKYFNWIHSSLFSRSSNLSSAPMPDDATCTYRTEDTPILSPSASVSDLSTLSFSEDLMFVDGSLNNSLRNSDCSSESEDELLQQCIRSGMPSEKRAHA